MKMIFKFLGKGFGENPLFKEGSPRQTLPRKNYKKDFKFLPLPHIDKKLTIKICRIVFTKRVGWFIIVSAWRARRKK